jgi:hypothetical protein
LTAARFHIIVLSARGFPPASISSQHIMACTRSFNIALPAASIALAVVASLYWAAGGECAQPERSAFSLQGDKELNMQQTCDTRKQVVRIGSDYLCASLSEYHVLIVARAPQWTVRLISVPRKIYTDVALKDWLRRGPPTSFLHLTTLPDWPCVRTGEVPFLSLPATKFAMPYLLKGKSVPLKQGTCGELLALCQGLPPEAAQIMEPYYRTPKGTGFPLRLRVWDFEKYSDKPNPVFIYSGGKSDDGFDLLTTKVWISKRQPLPSVTGYKIRTNVRDVWVNQTQLDDFGEFMRK